LVDLGGGEGGERVEDKPICAHTISVIAPMNCGVAEAFNLVVSSSTIFPTENQREAFRRSRRAESLCDILFLG
jgi:hypothetical protein